MLSEFQMCVPTSVLHQGIFDGKNIVTKVVRKLRFGWIVDRFQRTRLQSRYGGTRRPDLIFANTITHGNLLGELPIGSVPVITHVHELEYAIKSITSAASMTKVKAHTSHYIACAGIVRDNLTANHDVAIEKIEVVPEFIQPSICNPEEIAAIRAKLRSQWRIPQSAFVIAACGTANWRKGVDLFAPLAANLMRTRQKNSCFFVWIGEAEHENTIAEALFDAQRLEVQDHVRFVGVRPNPAADFAAIDAFALLSREDPFPLTCLEAASAGKPIVCFQSAGGMPDFVGNDCGFCVPYLNLDAMAGALGKLIDSPELAGQLGKHGAEKVRQFEVNVVAPKLWNVIIQSFERHSLAV